MLAGVTAVALAGGSENPQVEIVGGADASGQNYQWTVTNHHSSPIVNIRFPHYHADQFAVPKGWASECTNLSTRESGACTASVVPPAEGIRTGRSAEFGMRLANLSGHHHRPGEVTVRFADGSVLAVADVELPTPSSTSERLVTPIALVLVFGIMLLVQLRRRRKARSAGSPEDPPNNRGS